MHWRHEIQNGHARSTEKYLVHVWHWPSLTLSCIDTRLDSIWNSSEAGAIILISFPRLGSENWVRVWRGSLRARGWRIWCLLSSLANCESSMDDRDLLWSMYGNTVDGRQCQLRFTVASHFSRPHTCVYTSTHIIIVFHLSVFAVEEIKLRVQYWCIHEVTGFCNVCSRMETWTLKTLNPKPKLYPNFKRNGQSLPLCYIGSLYSASA